VADSSAIAGTQPGAPSHPLHTASGPWPTYGRSHVTPIAGAADSPPTSHLAARYLRLSSGQGHVTLVAGDRQLTVSRPAGRAVLAAAYRAGARVLGAAWSPDRRRRSFCSPPAGRPRGSCSTRLVGGAWPRQSVDVIAARWPVGCPSSLHCARARGRAGLGPVGRSSPLSLCPGPRPGRTRPSRLLLFTPTVPGPAAGPDSALSAAPPSPRFHRARARSRDGHGPGRASHRPVGGPRPAPSTVVAVSPAVRRSQSGRCGVLTRILVGAAAAAGPGRPGPLAELAGPDQTTRHGDEAAASSSCRLPVPLQVLQGCTAAPCNVTPCTLVEAALRTCRTFLRVLPSPSIFSALLLLPSQHPLPHPISFCSDSYRRQASPSAGHYPAGPGGPAPPSESARELPPAPRAGTALHRAP
jgi:hypothetical protein